jgi:hypothetical protein
MIFSLLPLCYMHSLLLCSTYVHANTLSRAMSLTLEYLMDFSFRISVSLCDSLELSCYD